MTKPQGRKGRRLRRPSKRGGFLAGLLALGLLAFGLLFAGGASAHLRGSGESHHSSHGQHHGEHDGQSSKQQYDHGHNSPPPTPTSHKVTLCHARPADTAKNGWVVITIDDNGVQGDKKVAGHANEHDADIIPVFTYSDGTQFTGKNLGDLSTFGYTGVTGRQVLANGCVLPATSSTTPPPTHSKTPCPPKHTHTPKPTPTPSKTPTPTPTKSTTPPPPPITSTTPATPPPTTTTTVVPPPTQSTTTVPPTHTKSTTPAPTPSTTTATPTTSTSSYTPPGPFNAGDKQLASSSSGSGLGVVVKLVISILAALAAVAGLWLFTRKRGARQI